MDWINAKRILCVRLDNIGDLIMTVPAIRALKDSDSSRQLTLMVAPGVREAALLLPFVDEVIVYEAPWVKGPSQNDAAADHDIIEKLKRRQFDAAVIFTVFSQSPLPAAFLCRLAGIPLCLAHCHENPYQLLNPWIKDPDPQEGIRHEVERQLDLVSAIGAKPHSRKIELPVPVSAKNSVYELLSERGIKIGKRLILIHPGATAASRRYPSGKYMQAAWALAQDPENQIIFTGQQDERGLIGEVKEPLFSLMGELSFGQMVALIAMADVLISNNTAPAHIAAGVNTPVVDLYALTNPQHTPWMVASRVLFHDVPCRNCFKSVCPQGHHQCLDLVPWERVVSMVKELLGETVQEERICIP